MPVQINEIIVRTVVDTQTSNDTAPQQADTAGNHDYRQEEWFERVLEIIQESKER